MLRWLIRRRLRKFETLLDYDARYLHEMLDISWRGFMKFSAVARLEDHRENLPLNAVYAARIVAAMSGDCGPCVQLNVRMARCDGVETPIVRAILEGDELAMGPDAALAFRFAEALLARDAQQLDGLREQVLTRWGRRGVLALGTTIAAGRIFPTVKYAMGHGKTCERIELDGVFLAVNRRGAYDAREFFDP
ncbi:MAG TPA: hypothetical protein VEC06_08640 [Paucimonas sp.]|nr:hypothetical protein [Paucimonas sp.]